MDETGSDKVLKVRSQPKVFDYVAIGLVEFVGTAILLFLSCTGTTLSIQGDVSIVQVSFNTGLTVMAVIQMFGHVSGAHINPAVTLSALLLNQITPLQAPVYVIAQILGCLAGCAVQLLVTPGDFIGNGGGGHAVCVTAPHGGISDWQAFGVEMALTAILVFAIISTWDRKNADKMDSVPVRVGLVVVVCNLAAAAYTGASMNPVRSFGPAVWRHDYTSHWIYWVGPTIGSLLATYFYKYVVWRE